MNAHQTDADCTVDPNTNLCTGCGVEHGEPCIECGGKGFHTVECALVDGFKASHPINLDIKVLESLEEAIRILNRARGGAASGSTTIWRILMHASEYLDEQIAAGIGR